MLERFIAGLGGLSCRRDDTAGGDREKDDPRVPRSGILIAIHARLIQLPAGTEDQLELRNFLKHWNLFPFTNSPHLQKSGDAPTRLPPRSWVIVWPTHRETLSCEEHGEDGCREREAPSEAARPHRTAVQLD